MRTLPGEAEPLLVGGPAEALRGLPGCMPATTFSQYPSPGMGILQTKSYSMSRPTCAGASRSLMGISASCLRAGDGDNPPRAFRAMGSCKVLT